MYTLNFPITLPAEYTFFDNGQYPVPPLPVGLVLSCFSLDGGPLILRVTGFAAESAALNFGSLLRHALRVAALTAEHSILLPEGAPVTAGGKHFDGSVPTVTPTNNNALPYHATSLMQTGLHISVLARHVGDALGGAAQKAAAAQSLVLAMQLFAECQFAGAQNSQFIVLMTALEILVPGNASGRKRGAVLGYVKKALTAAGHSDPKAVKLLDDLYVVRNALIHEAHAVTAGQLTALRQTVRDTLEATLHDS